MEYYNDAVEKWKDKQYNVTFAPLDDIQPTELSPWIGFIYTFPEYRGHRYAGMLLDYAESIATVMEREYIYL